MKLRNFVVSTLYHDADGVTTLPGELDCDGWPLTNVSIIHVTQSTQFLGFETSYQIRLYAPSIAGNIDVQLPASPGTLALVSQIPDVSAYMPLAGGTMAGGIDMGSHDLTGVGSINGVTPAADNTYANPTSITIINGIITAIS